MRKTPQILAIDDSKEILYAIAAICEAAGWDSLLALDGLKGLTMIRNMSPDLVLVDFHMPGIDGISTVKEIRAINSTIPIVVLTVEEDQRTADRFFKAGADDYAVKPIKAPDLIARINVHLRIREKEEKEQRDQENVSANSFDELAGSFQMDDLPKGISQRTMAHLMLVLKQEEGGTINELSQKSGLAYQTAHRYLQYLQERDVVEVESIYGKQGRPLQGYRLKKRK